MGQDTYYTIIGTSTTCRINGERYCLYHYSYKMILVSSINDTWFHLYHHWYKYYLYHKWDKILLIPWHIFYQWNIFPLVSSHWQDTTCTISGTGTTCIIHHRYFISSPLHDKTCIIISQNICSTIDFARWYTKIMEKFQPYYHYFQV